MTNDRILELISRVLSGEAAPSETAALEKALAEDSNLMERYKLMQQFWNEHETVSPAEVEQGLNKVLDRLQLVPTTPVVILSGKGSIRRLLKRMLAAAVVIMLLGGIGYWYVTRQNINIAQASLLEKHNARGTKSTIVLPDGSKIWLNADSKIKYPPAFVGHLREVYLSGEAFFDVARDATKPFIIHLSKGTIKVVGTSFNIRAYENEKLIETSVSTGRVAFIPARTKAIQQPDTIFITPNNKVRYSLNDDQVKIEPTAAAEDKAWTEGKLIFKALTLEEIAIELERNFGKKVVFVDEEPKQYRLTGTFENNSLEDILFYLSKTKDFNYKITNSELLIATNSTKLPQ
jgi:ferric-dicitrate binding protein FerR (iron transport regulator)